MAATPGTWAVVVILDHGHEVRVGSIDAERCDLAVVDTLARFMLSARRLGFDVRLRELRPELASLLGFVGFDDALRPVLDPAGQTTPPTPTAPAVSTEVTDPTESEPGD
jgi:hypothetical protein